MIKNINLNFDNLTGMMPKDCESKFDTGIKDIKLWC